MSIELKVKAYSLAEESKYIRKQENKMKNHYRWCVSKQKDASESQSSRSKFWRLRNHRVRHIRPEARATHLARAYLKGMPRSKVEKWPTASWDVKVKAMKMIKRYIPLAVFNPKTGHLEELKYSDSMFEKWYFEE